MLSGGLLRDLALKIDEIDFTSPHDVHLMAFLYERILRDVRDAAGSAGEFYTPRPVIRFMVQQSYITGTDLILDPACGTGGFLVEAFAELTEQLSSSEVALTSQVIPWNREKAASFSSLYDEFAHLHRMNQSVISRQNALLALTDRTRRMEQVDAVLTNPPFGGEEESAVFEKFVEDYVHERHRGCFSRPRWIFLGIRVSVQ